MSDVFSPQSVSERENFFVIYKNRTDVYRDLRSSLLRCHILDGAPAQHRHCFGGNAA